MVSVPAHEEELSVVHLESDDESLFLLHRSGRDADHILRDWLFGPELQG